MACLALLGAFPLATPAEDPTARGFDADPIKPAISLDGGFTVETARAAPAGTRSLGALLDLSGGLLRLKLGSQRKDLLTDRLTLHLLGGWSLGRVELGAHLPVALSQASDFSLLTAQGVTGPLVAPVAGTALGDLRLGAKLPVLDGAAWPLDLALLADLRLPTGDRAAFMGDGLALATSVIGTRRWGRVRLDGQLGYLFRGTGQYAQLVVHDGVTWGVGGGLDLPPLRRVARWKAIAELAGAWPRGFDASTDRYRAPLSLRAGLRAWLAPRWSAEAGLGTGPGETGYGHERWRVFVGVRWTAEPPGLPDGDDDGDGVPNSRDRCPDVPGPPENDGCPLPEPAPEPLVELQSERISLTDAVHFDTGLDTIKPESHAMLDQVATLIRRHEELKRIRIEGHTDDVGTAEFNLDLSARRAQAVLRYLVARGVASSRLETAGYGLDRPVASNATEEGRARNRRVEFLILSTEP
jgi:outer membrane protein OmpA-like peptidoglycan-associated protein